MTVFMLFTAVLLLALPTHTVSPPPFSITADAVRTPTECNPHGWSITYDRTTTFSDLDASVLTRYFVQYVDEYQRKYSHSRS